MIIEPLITARLVLKSLSEEDAEGDYSQWLKDQEVVQYLEVRHNLPDLGQLKQFIVGLNKSPDNVFLGIFLKPDLHIGTIKLGPINWADKIAPLGIMIGDKACWGKGYAVEAIQSLTDYAFNQLELEKIYAGCYKQNVGSFRAFSKVGYRLMDENEYLSLAAQPLEDSLYFIKEKQ